jgi:predicted GH43/DUF377 family glycosyl hydrolase
LTAARSDDGVHEWEIDAEPTLVPEPERHPEEIWGIEDPRVTRLEELQKWAIAYTAFSRGGPLVSLATTTDFRNFVRLGPVMPPEDKDAAVFPVRFKGRWAMFHRPGAKSLSADIWISFSPDLKHWGDHQEVIHAREGGWWDANKIGLSAPPMETPEGWLILYHGVRTTASGSIYRLGLTLLDLEEPTRVIRRSEEWVFGPKAHYEREGDVDDVVFPCGWVRKGSSPPFVGLRGAKKGFGDPAFAGASAEKALRRMDETIFMYYGAADSCIGLATAKINELVEFLHKG